MLKSNKMTEEFIEVIKGNPCLYDTTHKQFSNKTEKDKVWKKIAQELGVEEKQIRQKWKNLKYNYMNHKQLELREPGQKVTKHLWKNQLKFLDNHIDLPRKPQENSSKEQSLKCGSRTSKRKPITPKKGKVLKPNERNTKLKLNELNSSTSAKPLLASNETILKQTPVSSLISSSNTNERLLLQTMQNLENCNTIYDNIVNLSQPDSSTLLPQDFLRISMSTPSEILLNETEMIVNEDNEYVNNKKSQKMDEIDYLFLSYSETFRKLSERNKVHLKLKLANIFAEAEFHEMQEN